MKIKKQYLNEESLKPYGFERIVQVKPYENEYYICRCIEHDITVSQYEDGVIFIECWEGFTLDDVIYRLIVDGMVEPWEEQGK